VLLLIKPGNITCSIRAVWGAE